jgi:hypothetical protein
MIRKHFCAASLALCFALGCAPMLQAQSQSQEPKTTQDTQKNQTLLGKVVKTRTGQYALLTDEQNGKGVYLDDQDKAKEFEGKNVKVTGVLDVATNMLHVSTIELA